MTSLIFNVFKCFRLKNDKSLRLNFCYYLHLEKGLALPFKQSIHLQPRKIALSSVERRGGKHEMLKDKWTDTFCSGELLK